MSNESEKNPGGDPYICARCAMQGPSCCRTNPAVSNKCFPLSEAEKTRLEPFAATLGVASAGEEENTPEFLQAMRVIFPGRGKILPRVFPPDGTHWRLPLGEDGECLFLREEGCALPRDARPWYCQLFPLWVIGKSFDRFLPEMCLLTHEAPRLQDVFSALHMTKEQARTLYVSLCRDWGMEKE